MDAARGAPEVLGAAQPGVPIGKWDRRGTRNPSVKLTIADVRRVRERIASGDTDQVIAADYHVTYQAIRHIRTGHNWASLD